MKIDAMKIRSLIVTVGVLAPLVVLAQGAPPQGGPGGPPPGGAPAGAPPMAGGDAMGGDKSLDQKPFFASLDANHDGKVTLAEWKAAGMPENVYSMIDARKTGAASFADFEAHPPMTSFDANKDKKVTLEEMKTAIEKQMKAGGPGGGPGGPGGPGGGPGGPGGPPPGGGAPPGQAPAPK
ncbi:MAG: hypothetical protein U1F06_02160 [Steroidobacteraceae bacterium]